MTERFSLEQFQQALPIDKDGGKLWYYIGLEDGEHTFSVPVLRNDGDAQVEIIVRSSVREDGYAADTGEDSIRCWLADSVDRQPLMGKTKRWIARTSGWRGNLKNLLRDLYKVGLHLGTCPKCKIQDRRAYVVKKSGPNHGRIFASCKCGNFEWVDKTWPVKRSAGGR